MTDKEELIKACSILREYLEPYVCGCNECDDCSFCAGDTIHELRELEGFIRQKDKMNG